MTDSGLTNRLRQHSRRAGIMVGLSMALTIALLIGAFAVIYGKIDPLTRDFVDAATGAPKAPTTAKTATKDPTAPGAAIAGDPLTEIPAAAPTDAAQPTVATDVTPQPTAGTAFKATHKVSSSSAVNLRSGPSRDTDPVTTVASGQTLQYLNEERAAANPADDGKRWLRFRTQTGEEGWIREIDVETVPAGQ